MDSRREGDVMKPVCEANRLRGALWGMFVGDALAMPAHWYYDVAALQRDFGTIRDYLDPTDHHPNSILSLASTGAAGRGSHQGEVVGSVILQGKKQLWDRPNRHYHHGLRGGDNTLNLLVVRCLLRTMNSCGRYDSSAFLDSYVRFMTTADSHGDTYAESYHRAFFANYAQGVPPARCAGAEGHDTASIGGLVSLPLVIVAALNEDDPSVVDRTLLEHLRLTHRSPKLDRYALEMGRLFGRLLRDVGPAVATSVSASAKVFGFPVAKVVDRMKREGRSDLDVIGGMLSPACYIEDSFPAVLYLAARYVDDFEAALVANANAGGDNCHRGAVLGGLLGAALGYQSIPDRWIRGLRSHGELEAEIESFVGRFS